MAIFYILLKMINLQLEDKHLIGNKILIFLVYKVIMMKIKIFLTSMLLFAFGGLNAPRFGHGHGNHRHRGRGYRRLFAPPRPVIIQSPVIRPGGFLPTLGGIVLGAVIADNISRAIRRDFKLKQVYYLDGQKYIYHGNGLNKYWIKLDRDDLPSGELKAIEDQKLINRLNNAKPVIRTIKTTNKTTTTTTVTRTKF